MKTRLLLEEEEVITPTEEEVVVEEPIPEEEIVNFNISSFVTDLIKSKWEQVDNINGMIMTLTDINPETIEILKDIISDEYVHIGQLEKVVQSINPEAEALDTGASEEVIK